MHRSLPEDHLSIKFNMDSEVPSLISSICHSQCITCIRKHEGGGHMAGGSVHVMSPTVFMRMLPQTLFSILFIDHMYM